jgi:rubrerythrin
MNLDDVRRWHLEYAARMEKGEAALEPEVREMVNDNANWHRRAASVCGVMFTQARYWECTNCGNTNYREEPGCSTRWCDGCGAEDNGDLPFGSEVVR